MKKTLNQITALSDEVSYHLDVQHPTFLLSIFLCISGVGAKTALGGVNPESDIELEAARGPILLESNESPIIRASRTRSKTHTSNDASE